MKRLTLRAHRKRADLTQRELALRSRIDQRAISKIEVGKVADPSFSTGMALADALEIDPHRLLFGAVDSTETA